MGRVAVKDGNGSGSGGRLESIPSQTTKAVRPTPVQSNSDFGSDQNEGNVNANAGPVLLPPQDSTISNTLSFWTSVTTKEHTTSTMVGYRPSTSSSIQVVQAPSPPTSPPTVPQSSPTRAASEPKHLLPGHIALIASFSFLACVTILVGSYWLLMRKWKRQERARQEEERRIINEIRESQKERLKRGGKSPHTPKKNETLQLRRTPSKAPSVRSWLHIIEDKFKSGSESSSSRRSATGQAIHEADSNHTHTIKIGYSPSIRKSAQELRADEVARQLPGNERYV